MILLYFRIIICMILKVIVNNKKGEKMKQQFILVFLFFLTYVFSNQINTGLLNEMLVDKLNYEILDTDKKEISFNNNITISLNTEEIKSVDRIIFNGKGNFDLILVDHNKTVPLIRIRNEKYENVNIMTNILLEKKNKMSKQIIIVPHNNSFIKGGICIFGKILDSVVKRYHVNNNEITINQYNNNAHLKLNFSSFAQEENNIIKGKFIITTGSKVMSFLINIQNDDDRSIEISNPLFLLKDKTKFKFIPDDGFDGFFSEVKIYNKKNSTYDFDRIINESEIIVNSLSYLSDGDKCSEIKGYTVDRDDLVLDVFTGKIHNNIIGSFYYKPGLSDNIYISGIDNKGNFKSKIKYEFNHFTNEKSEQSLKLINGWNYFRLLEDNLVGIRIIFENSNSLVGGVSSLNFINGSISIDKFKQQWIVPKGNIVYSKTDTIFYYDKNENLISHFLNTQRIDLKNKYKLFFRNTMNNYNGFVIKNSINNVDFHFLLHNDIVNWINFNYNNHVFYNSDFNISGTSNINCEYIRLNNKKINSLDNNNFIIKDKSFYNINTEGYNILRISSKNLKNQLNYYSKIGIDTIKPNIKIINPEFEYIKSENIHFESIIYDISDLKYEINGEIINDKERYISKNINIDISEEFVFKAIDSAGNQSIIKRNFIIDNIPPIITLNNYKKKYTKESEIILSLNIKDESLYFIEVGNKKYYTKSDGDFNLPVQLKEGENKIRITAYDKAKNVSVVDLEYYLDIVKPDLSNILSIYYKNSKSKYILLDIFDEIPVNLSLSDEQKQPVKFELYSKKYDKGRINYTYKIFYENKKKINLIVQDIAGNISSKSFDIKIDDLAPVIEFDNLIPKQVNNENLYIKGRLLDDNPASITVHNIDYNFKSEENTFEFNIPLTEGENKLIFTAKDKANNSTTFEHIVYLDTISPDISQFNVLKRVDSNKISWIQNCLDDDIDYYEFKREPEFKNGTMKLQVTEFIDNFDINMDENDKKFQYSIRVFDKAGNFSTWKHKSTEIHSFFKPGENGEISVDDISLSWHGDELEYEQKITINIYDESQISLEIPFITNIVDFGPDLLNFDKDIELSFKILDGSAIADKLTWYHYNEKKRKWEIIPTYYDEEKQSIITWISHFSSYALGEKKNEEYNDNKLDAIKSHINKTAFKLNYTNGSAFFIDDETILMGKNKFSFSLRRYYNNYKLKNDYDDDNLPLYTKYTISNVKRFYKDKFYDLKQLCEVGRWQWNIPRIEGMSFIDEFGGITTLNNLKLNQTIKAGEQSPYWYTLNKDAENFKLKITDFSGKSYIFKISIKEYEKYICDKKRNNNYWFAPELFNPVSHIIYPDNTQLNFSYSNTIQINWSDYDKGIIISKNQVINTVTNDVIDYSLEKVITKKDSSRKYSINYLKSAVYYNKNKEGSIKKFYNFKSYFQGYNYIEYGTDKKNMTKVFIQSLKDRINSFRKRKNIDVISKIIHLRHYNNKYAPYSENNFIYSNDKYSPFIHFNKVIQNNYIYNNGLKVFDSYKEEIYNNYGNKVKLENAKEIEEYVYDGYKNAFVWKFPNKIYNKENWFFNNFSIRHQKATKNINLLSINYRLDFIKFKKTKDKLMVEKKNLYSSYLGFNSEKYIFLPETNQFLLKNCIFNPVLLTEIIDNIFEDKILNNNAIVKRNRDFILNCYEKKPLYNNTYVYKLKKINTNDSKTLLKYMNRYGLVGGNKKDLYFSSLEFELYKYGDIKLICSVINDKNSVKFYYIKDIYKQNKLSKKISRLKGFNNETETDSVIVEKKYDDFGRIIEEYNSYGKYISYNYVYNGKNDLKNKYLIDTIQEGSIIYNQYPNKIDIKTVRKFEYGDLIEKNRKFEILLSDSLIDFKNGVLIRKTEYDYNDFNKILEKRVYSKKLIRRFLYEYNTNNHNYPVKSIKIYSGTGSLLSKKEFDYIDGTTILKRIKQGDFQEVNFNHDFAGRRNSVIFSDHSSIVYNYDDDYSSYERSVISSKGEITSKTKKIYYDELVLNEGYYNGEKYIYSKNKYNYQGNIVEYIDYEDNIYKYKYHNQYPSEKKTPSGSTDRYRNSLIKFSSEYYGEQKLLRIETYKKNEYESMIVYRPDNKIQCRASYHNGNWMGTFYIYNYFGEILREYNNIGFNVVKNENSIDNIYPVFYDETIEKEFTYNSLKLVTQIDIKGIEYDLSGKSNLYIKYDYDGLNRIIRKTTNIDMKNNDYLIKTYKYDALDRVIEVNEVNNNKTFDATTIMKYDLIGNLVEIKYPYFYNNDGKKVIISEKRKYNIKNEIIEKKKINTADKLVEIEYYQYDCNGNQIVSYNKYCGDEENQKKVIEKTIFYNLSGLIDRIEYSDGDVVYYKYNKNGKIISIINNHGGKKLYFYDEDTRLVLRVMGYDNNYWGRGYLYDDNGYVKYRTLDFIVDTIDEIKMNNPHEFIENQIKNNKVKVIEYLRNLHGNEVEVKYPDGRREIMNYDKFGRLNTVEDNNGGVKLIEYYNNNQIKSEIMSNDTGILNSIKYEYNKDDKLIRELIGEKDEVVREYVYDAKGRLITEILDGDSIISTHYNTMNIVNKIVYPDKREVQLNYDSLLNLNNRIYTYGQNDQNFIKENYLYDENLNLNEVIIETQKEGEKSILSEKYNYSNNKITEYIFNDDNISYKTLFNQDNNKNQAILKYPGHEEDIIYNYDPLGRLNNIKIKDDYVSIDYEKNNIKAVNHLNNDLQNIYDYDNLGRLTSQFVKYKDDKMWENYQIYDSKTGVLLKETTKYDDNYINKEFQYDNMHRVNKYQVEGNDLLNIKKVSDLDIDLVLRDYELDDKNYIKLFDWVQKKTKNYKQLITNVYDDYDITKQNGSIIIKLSNDVRGVKNIILNSELFIENNLEFEIHYLMGNNYIKINEIDYIVERDKYGEIFIKMDEIIHTKKLKVKFLRNNLNPVPYYEKIDDYIDGKNIVKKIPINRKYKGYYDIKEEKSIFYLDVVIESISEKIETAFEFDTKNNIIKEVSTKNENRVINRNKLMKNNDVVYRYDKMGRKVITISDKQIFFYEYNLKGRLGNVYKLLFPSKKTVEKIKSQNDYVNIIKDYGFKLITSFIYNSNNQLIKRITEKEIIYFYRTPFGYLGTFNMTNGKKRYLINYGKQNSKLIDIDQSKKVINEETNYQLDMDYNSKILSDNITMQEIFINQPIFEFTNSISDDNIEIKGYGRDSRGNIRIVYEKNNNSLLKWNAEYELYGRIQKIRSNFSNYSPLKSYALHEFDNEIDLYYAQNRWYDYKTGRFITEDPIKDGQNWYTFCGNALNSLTDSKGHDVGITVTADSVFMAGHMGIWIGNKKTGYDLYESVARDTRRTKNNKNARWVLSNGIFGVINIHFDTKEELMNYLLTPNKYEGERDSLLEPVGYDMDRHIAFKTISEEDEKMRQKAESANDWYKMYRLSVNNCKDYVLEIVSTTDLLKDIKLYSRWFPNSTMDDIIANYKKDSSEFFDRAAKWKKAMAEQVKIGGPILRLFGKILFDFVNTLDERISHVLSHPAKKRYNIEVEKRIKDSNFDSKENVKWYDLNNYSTWNRSSNGIWVDPLGYQWNDDGSPVKF